MGTAVFLLVLDALALRAAGVKGGFFSAAFGVKGEIVFNKT